MSRSRALPRFKGRKPEELADHLERLVDEVEAELRSLRSLRSADWAIHPTTLTPGGVHALAWQTGYVCQTASADVDVRLPYARRENLGQSVAVIKPSGSNEVNVYPSGGQLVQGATVSSPSGAGWRQYVWTGDGELRGWRLVS